jgi:hypothetical protein
VAGYRETGELSDPSRKEATARGAADLIGFLASAQAGDYVALQAFVEPTRATDAALETLRVRLRDRLKLATTAGYGPRFLHSTGQLHKGGVAGGLFMQFTSDGSEQVPIPDKAGSDDSSVDFGTLKTAQALGDKQALEEAGRRVIRFHLEGDPAHALQQLADALA